MPVSKRSAKGGFSISVGMTVVRSALPQRSPIPFSVPWIWRAPALTAASEFATAWPVSLCAWMPSRARREARRDLGHDRLDLVGQRAAIGVAQHAQRAPASSAASTQASA